MVHNSVGFVEAKFDRPMLLVPFCGSIMVPKWRSKSGREEVLSLAESADTLGGLQP
jgi:hypothetical protein